MYSLPWPVSCKSSIDSFVKSFLTFKTCFETFLLQNLTMVVPLLPTRRQSSMSLSDTSIPAFVIALQTASSRSLSLTDDGMPEISRHSLLKYWAFAKHCFSIIWSLSDNRVFTFLWQSCLISFDQTLPSFYVAQQTSHCLLNQFCFANLQLIYKILRLS